MAQIFAYAEDEQTAGWLMALLSYCDAISSQIERDFVKKYPITLKNNVVTYFDARDKSLFLNNTYDIVLFPSFVQNFNNYPEAIMAIKSSNVICLAMRGKTEKEENSPLNARDAMADIVTKTAFINYIANGIPIVIFYFGEYISCSSTPADNLFINNCGDKIMIDIRKANDKLPAVRAINDFYNYCPAIADLIMVRSMENIRPAGKDNCWNSIGKYLFEDFSSVRSIKCNHNIVTDEINTENEKKKKNKN